MKKLYSKKLRYGNFVTFQEKPLEQYLEVKQVHGTLIASQETLPCEADGIFSSWEELKSNLLIKTADCMPIVIEGKKGVVFLHAGWRGLASGILSESEIKLIDPEYAFIGPCIQSCCFEVSGDFKSNFPRSHHFQNKNNKLYFDLVSEAMMILKSNYNGIKIDSSEECTCCKLIYNSYRRNKTNLRNYNLYIKG